MKMSNLISRHLGFFPKGLAYHFGSKFFFFKLYIWSNVTWKWCLLIFLSEIKVTLTKYEHIRFKQPPSWIFWKGVSLWFWVKTLNFFQVCKCSNWPWKWCLVMFLSEIKVSLTIYEYIKFAQLPSWIFSKAVSLWFFGQNFKFPLRWYVLKLDLEIMFADV